MDFESLVKHPIIGQTIITAIEDGREWGQRCLNDPSWHRNKQRMANYAIQESIRSSQFKHNDVPEVDYEYVNVGNQDISLELHTNIYFQVKLASTLFTIYEIDTKLALMHPLIIAAAAGVEMQELADYLGTQTRKSAIQKALMTKRGISFWEVHRNLGKKLISRIYEKSLTNRKNNTNQYIPQNQITPVKFTFGDSVMSFIHAWNAL